MILGAKRPDTIRKRFLIVAQLLQGDGAADSIAREVNVPVTTVRVFLNGLVDGGYATRERRGESDPRTCYALTKKGRGYLLGELERWDRLGQQDPEIAVLISIGLT
jgi:predicted ArsR family transcriptional regulator